MEHRCRHEKDFVEMAEDRGMILNELKNMNLKFDGLIARVDAIQGKPRSLSDLWITVVIILVAMGGGIGISKII